MAQEKQRSNKYCTIIHKMQYPVSGKIIDLNGRILKNLAQINNKIDVSGLLKGMYILDLKIDNDSIIKKFIINK